ncbi:hypothetical protein MJH12_09010, partial [bacterium]|nr:hypothetical protein [bacterium]
MYLKKNIFIFFAILFSIVGSLSANNKAFVYGLNLTNASGTLLNLNTTLYSVDVSLYPSLTGGSAAATVTLSGVIIRNGFMQMSLFPSLVDGTLLSTNPYLEISITKLIGNTPLVMSPRIEIPYVPAAYEAYQVGNFTSADLTVIDNRSSNNDTNIGLHTSRIATLESNASTDQGNISQSQSNIATHSSNILNLISSVNYLETNQSSNASTLVITAAPGSLITSKIVVMSPSQMPAFVVSSSGRVLITSGLSFDTANILYGTQSGTHINLGKNSTTGQNGLDFSWITISGGNNHSASAHGATIAGGSGNTVSGMNSNISGGASNNVAGHHAAVLGGSNNTITSNANYSSILGGANLTINNEYSAGVNG